MPKSYLGDGVYADEENGMLKLTTEDGIDVTNEIFLEGEVIEALFGYISRTRGVSIAVTKRKEEHEEDTDTRI